jgi:hypothetical protein
MWCETIALFCLPEGPALGVSQPPYPFCRLVSALTPKLQTAEDYFLAVWTVSANYSIQQYGFSITKVYVFICLLAISPESPLCPNVLILSSD